MKRLIFILIISFGFHLKAEDVYLGIGETHRLKTNPGTPLIVQKKGILTIKDLGRHIVLTGKKLGKTRVQLGNKNFNLQVLPIESFQSFKALQEWIADKRGPRLEVQDKKVILKGRLLRLEDFTSLSRFQNEKAHFESSMDLSSEMESKIKSHFEKVLHKNNLVSGSWSFKPRFQLKLPPSASKRKSEYSRILNPFGVQIEVDSEQIQNHPLIEIKVYVAHVKKNFMRQFGVRWPGQISAQVIPDLPVKADSFSVTLDAMEAEGWGQTLATPVLITESGQWAQFHSGGEFPVQTTTQFNNTVEWKRYGLSLKTRPTTNALKELRVEIEMEVSSLDPEHSTGGVPALNRNELKTRVSMKTPRPFLLSGFTQQNSSEGDQGLPWLRQIPVLSPLFASGKIYDSEFELVFILVPRFYETQTF